MLSTDLEICSQDLLTPSGILDTVMKRAQTVSMPGCANYSWSHSTASSDNSEPNGKSDQNSNPRMSGASGRFEGGYQETPDHLE